MVPAITRNALSEMNPRSSNIRIIITSITNMINCGSSGMYKRFVEIGIC